MRGEVGFENFPATLRRHTGTVVADFQKSFAAFFAGASRTGTGSYLQSFVIAGFVAVAAAFLALMIGTKRQEAAPAAA